MKTKNIISSSLLLFCILKPTLSFPSAPFRLITTWHKGRAVNFANYCKRSKSIFLKQQQEDDDHHDGNVNKSNSSSLLPEGHSLSIEYCTGCRWLLRSAWLMQELFTTFNDEMGNITLIPSKPPSPGGTFIVKLNNDIIWNRKIDNGFPEAKELKQRVRDKIAPTKNLGHSDTTVDNTNDTMVTQIINDDECQECDDENANKCPVTAPSNENDKGIENGSILGSPKVRITYCTGCRWMLRSAWMSQELLTTFEQELHSVTLLPNLTAPGTFHIHIDKELIWDRKVEGGFPEIKELKERVRNKISPERSLGHIDDSTVEVNEDESVEDNDDMDDGEATDLRKFYGVL